MTMHILSAGDGYQYYTREVATADIKREAGRELGDYYTADGTPPGLWVGGGAALLGVSGSVSEEQMKALYGEGLHPDAEALIVAAQAAGRTPDQARKAAELGRGYYSYRTGADTLSDRIAEGYVRFERTEHREPDATERRLSRVREGAQAFREARGREPADKEELGRFITAASRATQQAVAGFDLVFAPAKSVSTLWALGDADTRKAIENAHQEAIGDTIRYLEREAVATRAGRNGVAQIEVDGGLIATRFRHYDSRNGDPQLHDHVVVANKVRGVDGKWRTLDSKLLYRMNVPASEYYNQAVTAKICDALGVTTEARQVTAGKRPVMEIAGVDTRLTEAFSSRSVDIKNRMTQLEAEYRERHGREPNQAARIDLAQQATLDTRPAKETARSLSELNRIWRAAAIAAAGQPTVDGLLASARLARAQRNDTPPASPPVTIAQAADEVIETVSEHRAVWGTHHVEAEARRWVTAQGAASGLPADAAEQITRAAIREQSVTITPPPVHGTFTPLTRSDGTSIYDHKGRTLHTSAAVLRAEDQLLTAARDRTLTPVRRDLFNQVVAAHGGRVLDAGQRALAAEFACSPARLVVGSGPAGTGKTTALSVAARAVEAAGGRMLGLAPSAVAAAVMRDAVGIPAVTIDRLLVGKGTLSQLNDAIVAPDGTGLRAGDVLVVDEAGMAGTVKLAKVVRLAELAGAHVRLIGDDRQLAAVEAGGALRLLEREVGAVHLETIHRFTDPGEAAASRVLRDPATTGNPFAWYVAHGRVVGGDADRITNQVFTGWQQDTSDGRQSLMLAANNSIVTDLNARAQAFRFGTGDVSGDAYAPLRDGLAAHVGDWIVTRNNDSRLTTNRGRDMVKNGDVWMVTAIREDGSVAVEHRGHGGRVTLPVKYMTEHVQLGYAATVHRAQGITVDSAHVLADAATTREAAYVALTRGREENRIYVETEGAQPMTDVLRAIAGNVDTSLSAHETIQAEQRRVTDLVVLIDQYEDVAARADELRFAQVATDVFGAAPAEVTDRDSWPALVAALKNAERAGYDPSATLASAVAQRELDTADDPGAVLHSRIEAALAQRGVGTGRGEPEPAVPVWIADPAPLTATALSEDWRAHLQERYDHLTLALTERGEFVAADQPGWAASLGRVPTEPAHRDAWVRLAGEVDVFRARYHVPDEISEAVPSQYRTHSTASHLAERVIELHKSDELRQRAQERRTPTDDAQHHGPTAQQGEPATPTAAERIDQWRQQQRNEGDPPTVDGWPQQKPTPPQHTPRV